MGIKLGIPISRIRIKKMKNSKKKPLVIDISVSKPTVFNVPERIRTSDLPLRRTSMLVFGSVKMVCKNGRNALKYVG